jgi:hypothetical protein
MKQEGPRLVCLRFYLVDSRPACWSPSRGHSVGSDANGYNGHTKGLLSVCLIAGF